VLFSLLLIVCVSLVEVIDFDLKSLDDVQALHHGMIQGVALISEDVLELLGVDIIASFIQLLDHYFDAGPLLHELLVVGLGGLQVGLYLLHCVVLLVLILDLLYGEA
jgi:hypothetical protein